MGTRPAANPEPKQGSGFVVTAVITALALIGCAALYYLLASSTGTAAQADGDEAREIVCASVAGADWAFEERGTECLGNYVSRLAWVVIVGIHVAALSAVALSRWIVHMGFGAKVLRVG